MSQRQPLQSHEATKAALDKLTQQFERINFIFRRVNARQAFEVKQLAANAAKSLLVTDKERLKSAETKLTESKAHAKAIEEIIVKYRQTIDAMFNEQLDRLNKLEGGGDSAHTVAEKAAQAGVTIAKNLVAVPLAPVIGPLVSLSMIALKEIKDAYLLAKAEDGQAKLLDLVGKKALEINQAAINAYADIILKSPFGSNEGLKDFLNCFKELHQRANHKSRALITQSNNSLDDFYSDVDFILDCLTTFSQLSSLSPQDQALQRAQLHTAINTHLKTRLMPTIADYKHKTQRGGRAHALPSASAIADQLEEAKLKLKSAHLKAKAKRLNQKKPVKDPLIAPSIQDQLLWTLKEIIQFAQEALHDNEIIKARERSASSGVGGGGGHMVISRYVDTDFLNIPKLKTLLAKAKILQNILDQLDLQSTLTHSGSMDLASSSSSSLSHAPTNSSTSSLSFYSFGSMSSLPNNFQSLHPFQPQLSSASSSFNSSPFFSMEADTEAKIQMAQAALEAKKEELRNLQKLKVQVKESKGIISAEQEENLRTEIAKREAKLEEYKRQSREEKQQAQSLSHDEQPPASSHAAPKTSPEKKGSPSPSRQQRRREKYSSNYHNTRPRKLSWGEGALVQSELAEEIDSPHSDDTPRSNYSTPSKDGGIDAMATSAEINSASSGDSPRSPKKRKVTALSGDEPPLSNESKTQQPEKSRKRSLVQSPKKSQTTSLDGVPEMDIGDPLLPNFAAMDAASPSKPSLYNTPSKTTARVLSTLSLGETVHSTEDDSESDNDEGSEILLQEMARRHEPLSEKLAVEKYTESRNAYFLLNSLKQEHIRAELDTAEAGAIEEVVELPSLT